MKLLLKSFATKLSIYVLSLTLIIFTAIMIIFYAYNRNQSTKYAIAHTHALLDNMVTKINSQLQTVETAVIQSTWTLERNLDNPDSLQYIISAAISQNNLIVGCGIAFIPDFYREKGKYFMPYVSFKNGQDGELIYQTLGSQEYDYPNMDWYLIPKQLKQSYWSEPYYDKGGSNIIMTSYSVPLFDKKGEIYAIFTAHISLTQFREMIESLKPYQSDYTYLISRKGSFLTHPDHKKIMTETVFSEALETNNKYQEQIGREMQAGRTGTVHFDNLGVDSYAFYTAIPNPHWSICTVCPSEVILQDLASTSRKIFYVFIIGMLILFLIIYSTIRKLVRPLEKFSESARLIATGRFDIELPTIKTNDEIKHLHDSLTYMQRSLSAYITELQQTTATKERIESELSIAHEIQMSMIPKIFPPYPERNDIDLHAVLRPAKEVSGDLYDFFIDKDRLYFVIGDVSGKGIPASLLMAITRSLFRTLSQHEDSPALIMNKMNSSISENNESNMFVTLIIGILDLRTGLLKLCNAGHNPPILITPDRKTELLEFNSQLFVGVSESHSYTDEEVILGKSSKLFLYTDGVTEAENASKEFYGEEKLLNTLSSQSNSDVQTTVNAVISSVSAHVQDAEVSDDLTILLIHYEPKTGIL